MMPFIKSQQKVSQEIQSGQCAQNNLKKTELCDSTPISVQKCTAIHSNNIYKRTQVSAHMFLLESLSKIKNRCIWVKNEENRTVRIL